MENSKERITLTKEAPDYTFDHEPTVEELRETAVRCMHEMLSMEWYTPSGYDYVKWGAVAGKQFMFEKDYVYSGLPYTNAQATIFGMLEYMDEKGGIKEAEIMKDAEEDQKETLGQAVNVVIGNTCTGCTGWATSSVCNSVRGGMISYTLTKKNGFYPVGDYDYDDTGIENLYEKTNTFAIMAAAGREKMYECYTKVLPADLVVENSEDPMTGHSMMAIEKAHTAYKEDGSIDEDESYILIQDQRAGFYDIVDNNGMESKTSGRLEWKASFKFLFDKGYMPVTTLEYMGKKPYEHARFSVEGPEKVNSLDTLSEVTVHCNYAMAVIKITAADDEGAKTTLALRVEHRHEIDTLEAFHFPMNIITDEAKENVKKFAGKHITVTVDCTAANGAKFEAVKFEIGEKQ